MLITPTSILRRYFWWNGSEITESDYYQAEQQKIKIGIEKKNTVFLINFKNMINSNINIRLFKAL